MGEVDERVPGVAPEGHRGRAGVVLLALEGDREVARADDAGDRSDPLAPVFEPRPLLDVRFGVADVSAPLAPLDRQPFEPRLAQGVAERLPLAVGGVTDRARRLHLAAEREAAEAGGERAFFVDPRRDVDREMLRLAAFRERARRLDAVDDPHRPVQPAAPGLGVRVRADEQGGPGIARAAEYRPDPVDARIEARFLHARPEPVAGLDVDRAQRRADDPDAARAEAAEPPEVAEQAVRIDGDVDGARWAAHPASAMRCPRGSLCRRWSGPCQSRGGGRRARREGRGPAAHRGPDARASGGVPGPATSPGRITAGLWWSWSVDSESMLPPVVRS